MLYKMHKLILKMEDLKMLAVKENKMELPKYLLLKTGFTVFFTGPRFGGIVSVLWSSRPT